MIAIQNGSLKFQHNYVEKMGKTDTKMVLENCRHFSGCLKTHAANNEPISIYNKCGFYRRKADNSAGHDN